MRISPYSQEAEDKVNEFKLRCETEKEFCEELYRDTTIRLLAHKYAYYILSGNFVDDIAYDMEEQSWCIMGRALGHLTEDDTSPCIDFDPNHPLADEGIKLAKTLKLRK